MKTTKDKKQTASPGFLLLLAQLQKAGKHETVKYLIERKYGK